MTSDYKVLGQSNPTAANLTDCYTVPASIQAVVSSVLIANRSATPTTFRISVAPAGAGDSLEQYIAYDAAISGNDVVDFTIGMTLDTTDVVRVYATDATLSFNVYGEEIGGSGGGGGGFAIGSSFLEATGADGNSLAAGGYDMPLTLDDSAGADLAIDGGDNTKLNVLTTGWYSVRFQAEFLADNSTTGLFQNCEQDIVLNGSPRWIWYMQTNVAVFTNGFVANAGNNLVVPAYAFTAGDVLIFRTIGAPANGNTWSQDLGEAEVVRLS